MGNAYYMDLDAYIQQLGFSAPRSLASYQQALTHSSHTYENGLPGIDSNERLEFLGDAVLKLVVSDLLLQLFPDYREGELTKIRAVLISDMVLAEIAKAMHLQHYLILGESERRSKGAEKTSTLACAFEALLGALYLDGKRDEIQSFLAKKLTDQIYAIDANKTKDNYKAVLQEKTQGDGLGLPEYHTVDESGPAHNRQFRVEVSIQGKLFGSGEGKTKKEAQQNAARIAYETLLSRDASAQA